MKSTAFVCIVRRQISGANIKISENKEDTDRRRMSISGSPEAVRTAQQLLTAKYDK